MRDRLGRELTGRENVLLNAVILGLTRAEARSRFDQIVDFAGLEAFMDTPVKQYSSGMYARLGFAVPSPVLPTAGARAERTYVWGVIVHRFVPADCSDPAAVRGTPRSSSIISARSLARFFKEGHPFELMVSADQGLQHRQPKRSEGRSIEQAIAAEVAFD